jgi:hypothetical protein
MLIWPSRCLDPWAFWARLNQQRLSSHLPKSIRLEWCAAPSAASAGPEQKKEVLNKPSSHRWGEMEPPKEEEHSEVCGAPVANRFRRSNQGAQVASAPPLLVAGLGEEELRQALCNLAISPFRAGLCFHWQRNSVCSPLASSLLVTLFDCHTRSPASIDASLQDAGTGTTTNRRRSRNAELLVDRHHTQLSDRISAILALPGAGIEEACRMAPGSPSVFSQR